MSIDHDLTALILPGIGNSDSAHWQSQWQVSHPNFVRVNQRDWNYPSCKDWVDTLEKAVLQNGENVILVAHSLGCLLVAHWANQTHRNILGALLVAPPSPDTETSADIFNSLATGFLPIPMKQLAFKSMVVASSNDPYCDLNFSKSCAESWGSCYVNIGDAGHINSASGLGTWPEGLKLCETLLA